jgi:RNA polymerase nonessential primary-like sigma factor
MAEVIADESEAGNPESLLQFHQQGNLLEDWLRQLSERQRLIVERRYGLNGMEVATLDVIATELGLTRERVRQIQMEGLDRLRKIIKRGGVSRDAFL